ncbi:MAG: formiminoglutamase [Saprospiraceae bacterium]|jgi:formiminoglutamase|uniref:formimidoylglutamase n=1 Tax=Patiriisocius sp. Uisw_047 TaxID=3230969 RepID=UPI0039E81FFA
MTHLIRYTREDLLAHTNKRDGEVKAGEVIPVLSQEVELKDSASLYVIIGIPEDIGVKANHGKAGTSLAWNAFLNSYCNIQHTEKSRLKNALVFGEIDCRLEMEEASLLEITTDGAAEKLGALVERIDHKVVEVIQTIVTAGKTPIIIGGGHNNAFGNIKGTSQALNKPISVINFDAHSDFRPLEHRHSGNGFSYAKEDGFLDKYYIFGLHRNYTSQEIIDRIEKSQGTIKIAWFEHMMLSRGSSIMQATIEADNFICDDHFGLEIDLDAIANMGSSAMNPVGFSVADARSFTKHFSSNKNCAYVHICEGAPAFELFPNQVGKVISYLVSDVISG